MIQYLEELIMKNWDAWQFNAPRPKKLLFIKTCGSPNKCSYLSVIFLVFSERDSSPICVVKMARDVYMNSIIINEYKSLDYFYKKLSYKMKESIPIPLFYGYFKGLVFLIESALEGDIGLQTIRLDCTYFKRKAVQKNIKAVERWLIRFQQETDTGTIQINEDFIESDMLHKINLFKSKYAINKEETAFLEELLNLFKHKANITIPKCVTHGDFYIENILFKNDKAMVFDWSFAVREYIPLWDLFMFANSFYVDTPEDSLGSFEKIFFTNNWFSHVIKEFLEGYFVQRGFDPQLGRLFFPLFLIHKAIRDPLKYGVHVSNNEMWKKKFNFYVENKERFII